jgi:hypothetical protein
VQSASILTGAVPQQAQEQPVQPTRSATSNRPASVAFATPTPSLSLTNGHEHLLKLKAEVRTDQIEIGTLKERLLGIQGQLAELRGRLQTARDDLAKPLEDAEAPSPADLEDAQASNSEIKTLREQVVAAQAQLRAVMQAIDHLEEINHLREANRVLRSENQQLRRMLSATQKTEKR